MPQVSDPTIQIRLLSPWRRGFQWVTSLVILLLPWIQPGGASLLRIDISTLSLYIFGQVLRIEELFLLLLFCLAFGALFLLVTLVSGRVWCGWACPQTTLNDLAEGFARRLRLQVKNNKLQGEAWRKTVAQLFYLLLSALVSANLIWYFIEPQRFFSNMVTGELQFGVWVTFIIIALVVYLDLALIRRLMCKEFCPYGRIQTTLVDRATLTLQMPESEKDRCIKCGSCVRACPMEIDIRQGYQVECINCGRCLDACRNVMQKRQQPGLIYYTFGIEKLAAKALLNPRTILLSLTLFILTSVLAFAIYNRADASLKVTVSYTAGSRILKDGQQITFFNAWINNRSTEDALYSLKAQGKNGAQLALKGQTEFLQLAAGKNRKLEYVLVSSPEKQPHMVEFILQDSNGKNLAVAEAQISPAQK